MSPESSMVFGPESVFNKVSFDWLCREMEKLAEGTSIQPWLLN